MLQTLLFLMILIMMAKKRGRGRRSMGRYIRGTVDEEIALGALAAKDVANSAFDEVVNERTLVSSIVAAYALQGYTLTTNDGPIMVGISHGDYSSAEIEAWIESTDSWNEGDLVAQEVAGRKIRRIGVFDTPQADTESLSLNDGKPIKTKLNWILNQGQTLNLWCYNMGAGPITTGATVQAQGHVNLFPK